MKIISQNKDVENEIIRCIAEYNEIHIAVAWASANTRAFNSLLKNKNKIRNTTIGTHFYQTSPDVLEALSSNQNVRFITQPNGVFHPKLYLFISNNRWAAILGSANFTHGALTINQELCVLITDEDDTDLNIKEDLLNKIQDYFEQARTLNQDDIIAYRHFWDKNRKHVNKISGQYGETISKKSPLDSDIMKMSWDDYVKRVKNDPNHNIKGRVELLAFCRTAFEAHEKYSEMPIDIRLTIAGLPNDVQENWGWFGSMKGSGVFYKLINENNPHISNALSHIPLMGKVTKQHYRKFIEHYLLAFPEGRDGIGTASRLLAMKRPDVFVCINSKNRTGLCSDFGIRLTGMNYERYWDEVVLRVLNGVWWDAQLPKKGIEKDIWMGRAALLDAVFYEA